MTWLKFSTLSWATRGVNGINDNIRNALLAASPQDVDENGNIIGRSAESKLLKTESARTTTWAVPRQQVDGTWAIPKPVYVGPDEVFGGVDLLAGVGGYTEIETPTFPLD